jgi:ribonuclease HII
VDNAVIDHMNIYQASLEAMLLAVRQLYPQPQYLLCDGFLLPGTGIPQEGIKGGDASSLSIAAASIVAKVIRDRIMSGFDTIYPCYGFARHKGYPTAGHREALRAIGPSPLHRRSYSGVCSQTPMPPPAAAAPSDNENAQ